MTAEHGGTYTYNYYYQSSDGWNWSGWAQALTTFGLLIFAAWQMRFIRKSSDATELAANAARDNAIASKAAAEASQQSARLAEDAIHIERPNLFITYVSVSCDRGKTMLSGAVQMRNHGKGAADVVGYIAKIELFDPDHDPSPDTLYGTDEEKHLSHPFYAGGERDGPQDSPRVTFDYKLKESDLADIVAKRRRAAAHGWFRYRGSTKREYTSHFLWWCRFPNYPNCNCDRGPKELNSHD